MPDAPRLIRPTKSIAFQQHLFQPLAQLDGRGFQAVRSTRNRRDLGRTRRTAEIIAQACGCDIIFDSRLRELNMGVLEKRHIDSLTEEEENWRRQLVNGTVDGRIPEGESMQELSDRVNAALESCRDLPQGSRPLLVSHGIALGCLVSTILGLPAWAERRLRLRNCSISRVDYQESLWLASGWVVETAGDISHLDAPALDELQR